MVTLLLDSTQLEVVLSVSERALSFRKGNVVSIARPSPRCSFTDDAWTWCARIPSPGTHVRGVIAMGTWRSAGGEDFAVIRRHRPSVVIDLDGHPEFQRVILTTRHGLALVQRCTSRSPKRPSTSSTSPPRPAARLRCPRRSPASARRPRRPLRLTAGGGQLTSRRQLTRCPSTTNTTA